MNEVVHVLRGLPRSYPNAPKEPLPLVYKELRFTGGARDRRQDWLHFFRDTAQAMHSL